MSTATVASANVTPNRVVTIKDVAAKAGVTYGTACNCMSKNPGHASAKTIAKVKKAAAELGYNVAVTYSVRQHAPANPLFASREAETASMRKLRSEGCGNAEIAHRCGVTVPTVNKRIGTQPVEITIANKKLAGKVRTAKTQIKKVYVHQQLIADYNAKVEALNAEMAKVKQMASEIEAMKKNAAKASKATGTPLLHLLPPTKVS